MNHALLITILLAAFLTGLGVYISNDHNIVWLTFMPSFDADMDIKYELYTRAYRNNPQILTADVNVVTKSDFKYTRLTKFLINGMYSKHSYFQSALIFKVFFF
jgi:hypothetical protein